jgi:predicted permease
MANFLISFNVVFPIFLMMLLGFVLRRAKIVGETTVKQVNNVIFRVFLPLMIFKNIYEYKKIVIKIKKNNIYII